MAKARHSFYFYKCLTLFFLIIPFANSMKGSNPNTQPSSTAGVKQNEKQALPSMHLKEPVTQNKLLLIGQKSIPAIFIFRAIEIRVEALKVLVKNAMEIIAFKFKADTQQDSLTKLLKGSKLTDEQMLSLLRGLADALKSEEKDSEQYVARLFQLFQQLGGNREKLKGIGQETELNEGILTAVVANEDAIAHNNMLNPIIEKINAECLGFLRQIRLELRLHNDYKKLASKFTENGNYLTERRRHSNNAKLVNLSTLNDAGKSLHKALEDAIEIPFIAGRDLIRNLKQKIIAKKEDQNVKKLVKLWDIAENVMPKLLGTELKKIHKEIDEKLEMPYELFTKINTKINAEAYNEGQVITDEIVEKRIQLALAETMLVYERLKAYYKFDECARKDLRVYLDHFQIRET